MTELLIYGYFYMGVCHHLMFLSHKESWNSALVGAIMWPFVLGGVLLRKIYD